MSNYTANDAAQARVWWLKTWSRERLLDSMSDDCFGFRVNSAPQQTVCMLEYVAALQAIQFAP